MNRFPARSTLFVLTLFAGVASATQAADIITLKSTGKVISGEVAKISPTKVVINAGLRKDKPTDVPVNDIARIEWDKEPRTLNAARNAEAAGRYSEAIKSYSAFLKDRCITNSNLQAYIEYFLARCEARQAVADSTKVAGAIQKLEAFQRKHPNSYHSYELLSLTGELQLASKAYQDAIGTFQKLEQSPWKDVQLAAKCSEARVLIAQNKSETALGIYTTVLSQVGNNAALKSLKNQASLGKAACLQATDKQIEALKVLQNVIDTSSIKNPSLLAETYILQGDSYRQLAKNKDALMAYLHVDVLFPKETKYHPKSLYYLSQLWAGLGKADRSADAKNRLQTEYPNSEWAKK